MSLSHLYSLKTQNSHCHYVLRSTDIMRFFFSVLGIRNDIRIELQAPVVSEVKPGGGGTDCRWFRQKRDRIL